MLIKDLKLDMRGFSNYNIPATVGNPPVANNPLNSGEEETTSSCTIDILITEQIMMSPLFFGNGDASAFYNVTTMDWQFNFLNQAANRVWSRFDNDAVSRVDPRFSSIQFNGFQ